MSGELLNDGINVFGRDAEGSSRGFIVTDNTIEEVKAHAQRNPKRLQAILDAENASDSPRKTLVEWLEGEQDKEAEAAKQAEADERQARADALDASLEAEAQRAQAASKDVGEAPHSDAPAHIEAVDHVDDDDADPES